MSPSTEVSFAVLLPTHRRPELASRSIESVLHQTFSDWQLIIVNDSPGEDYTEVEALVAGIPNTLYLKNETNIGKNASLNKALEHLEKISFKGYVVFLDDDDWLDSTCLEKFSKAIRERNFPTWLVSNRSTSTDLLTKNATGRCLIDYYVDSLLMKKFSGDATHCISFEKTAESHFSDSVKNGEEWFYFSQVALCSRIFLHLPINGTFSEGYLPDGLTSLQINKKEKLLLYFKLLNELLHKGVLNPYTATYMLLRLGKIFL